MKWTLRIAGAVALSMVAMASTAEETCNSGNGDICQMATFIALTMSQVPEQKDNLSVTSQGKRVSYSIVTEMSMNEVEASSVRMSEWAEDAQAAMCSTHLINAFVSNGGEFLYGLKGADFDIPILELDCQAG